MLHTHVFLVAHNGERGAFVCLAQLEWSILYFLLSRHDEGDWRTEQDERSLHESLAGCPRRPFACGAERLHGGSARGGGVLGDDAALSTLSWSAALAWAALTHGPVPAREYTSGSIALPSRIDAFADGRSGRVLRKQLLVLHVP